jgi:putative NADH-flavin reductase
MKIVVFGASGRTGSLIVEQALDAGHKVVAYIRKAGSIKFQHPNLKICIGNLTENLRIRDAITGADVCISALGGKSLTQHASEFIAGIHHIVTTMEEVGVKRFIYLSSMGAGESRSDMCACARLVLADFMLRIPLADHTNNEIRIAKSLLQWTVVRPGSLNNGPIDKNIKVICKKVSLLTNTSVSRASVAAFMLKQLKDKKYINEYVCITT